MQRWAERLYKERLANNGRDRPSASCLPHSVTDFDAHMGGPNGLLRAGWTRNSMKPGDVVTVDGFQARTGKSIGNATAVVLASTGQRLFAASSQGQ